MDLRKPSWLLKKITDSPPKRSMLSLLNRLALHTVCQEAHCPNLSECFGKKTATFMISGNICTRGCAFCAVGSGKPAAVDADEPMRIARAVGEIGLRHVVITSVTRDDLSDGGAFQFAETVSAIKRLNRDTSIEALIPDFQGNIDALRMVVEARPDIINHNIETVPRLYPTVRPLADYDRSLALLAAVKEMDPFLLTKSGLMAGLGETVTEVSSVMRDLRAADCDIFTIGQYLAPSRTHYPVHEYVQPHQFENYKTSGYSLGFQFVAASPFTRSSFNAAHDFQIILKNRRTI